MRKNKTKYRKIEIKSSNMQKLFYKNMWVRRERKAVSGWIGTMFEFLVK